MSDSQVEFGVTAGLSLMGFVVRTDEMICEYVLNTLS